MHEPARAPNDLERLFVERANAGDLEGLLSLYEPNAVVADGRGRIAVGREQIRSFLRDFLAERPRLDSSVQAAPLCSGDIALTSSRAGNGDLTAEIARRQVDGTWRWVVDQFTLGRHT